MILSEAYALPYEPDAVGAIGANAPEGYWICGITTFYQLVNACSNIKHPESSIEQPVSSIQYPASRISSKSKKR
jgi:hypothetical protein